MEGLQDPFHRSLKYHLLDHLKQDAQTFGAFDVLDAGTYEYSHKNFKEKHRSTSKRRVSAMYETIKRLNEQAQEERYSSFSRGIASDVQLRRGAPKTGYPKQCTTHYRDDLHTSLKQVLISHGLSDLSATNIIASLYRIEIQSWDCIDVVRSGYVLSCFSPSLLDVTQSINGFYVELPHITERISKHIVCSVAYGPTKQKRYDVLGYSFGVCDNHIRYGRAVLLFRYRDCSCEHSTEMVCLLPMDIVPPNNVAEARVGCVMLDDSLIYNTEHALPSSAAIIIPLTRIVTVAQVTPASIRSSALHAGAQCGDYRVYVNKFVSIVSINREGSSNKDQ